VHQALLAGGALDEAAEVLDAGDAARVELADLDLPPPPPPPPPQRPSISWIARFIASALLE
jgi:hypothetical protein